LAVFEGEIDMQGMASLTVALIIAALGLLGLGYGVYEMMTQAGPDAALKTAGGLAVYVIVCLALARLSW
jgi:hypothetical protein